ncbi:MAG: FHA domain-containing protein [Polyangiaceae bacterium]|nr:FHA domain-containing protein [Polyangiaceae bacterium]
MSSRSSAAKVAHWLVARERSDEAVSLLSAWAASGPNDHEGQELLAEALRIDPRSGLAKLAFERMEGITSKDHWPLDEAIAKYSAEEVAKLERQIARPIFMRAQVGFNNNTKYKGAVFHIQTEDSGLDRPHVITHLFADGGRVVKAHKRIYASEVHRPDIARFVRSLMKGQHMEMVTFLREGRFDEIIAGRAIGGIETLKGPPRIELQKLATKKETRVEVPAEVRIQSSPEMRAVSVEAADAAAKHDGAAPSKPAVVPESKAEKAYFRLGVQRSFGGGPAYYEPKGERALIGTEGTIALVGEKFCHPREAEIRVDENRRIWLRDLQQGGRVFLRIRQPVELEMGDEFIVGDELLVLERNPDSNDGPGPGPTYFYSSPKWTSSFRIAQIFEGGGKGACVVARGNTMQIGAVIGDFVFTADPLVDDQHCLVEEQAGAILLTDLNSRTGVFVRIKGEQELVAGDEIIIGRTRLSLQLLG